MSGNHSRRSFLKRSAVIAAGAAAMADPVAADSHTDSETTGGSSSGDAPYYDIERAVHAEVNRRRESRGLDPLAYNANIAAAAREYSRQMIAEDFFSHTAPGENSFAAHYNDDGVDCSSLGENILYRTRRAESPEAVAANVVDQWMNSAGHRENILGDWQSEGVGVAVTDDGTLYATQGFGSCPGTSDGSGGSSGGDDSGGSSSGDGSDSGSGDGGSNDSGDDGSGGTGGDGSSDSGGDGSGDTGGDGSTGSGSGGSAGSDSDGSGSDASGDDGPKYAESDDWRGSDGHDQWRDPAADDRRVDWWKRIRDGDAEDAERSVGDWCADWDESDDDW